MAERLIQKRWPWLAAAAAIVLAFLSTVVEVRVGDPDPRPVGTAEDIEALRERTDLNLLFILIDTLRADHLGAYGYERDTSPGIDRLASQGVRFARHLAQSSWTKSSMASLWTGFYPSRTGITRFDEIVPEEAVLPAEVLKQAGFRTIGIYRNGWVAPNFGFGQGFDVYTRPAPQPLPPSVRFENPTLKTRGTDQDALAGALEFLRIGRDDRWFLYIHMMDVHEYLYDTETAIFGSSYFDIYDNSIRWVDGVLEALLGHLAEAGLAEKTLVVLTSDHGEAFRERGVEGHARKVFRETTEVPFIMSFPFRLEPGGVVGARTRNVDVWPTLFELLGLEAPPDMDGRSLVPEILAAARGEAAPAGAETGFAHLDQHWGQRHLTPSPTVAVSEGSLRYVRIDRPNAPVLEQLFDASADPRELEDLSEEEGQQATLERLRTAVDGYLAETPQWGEAPKREIDDLELKQLRALGYAIP